MPELPEVETIRTDVLPVLRGRRLRRAVFHRPTLIALDPGALKRMLPSVVRDLSRHGKYLFLHLDSGLIRIHLRMTGQLLLGDAEPVPYRRLTFILDGGPPLVLADQRRFAEVVSFPGRTDEASCLPPTVGLDLVRDRWGAADLRPLCQSRVFVRDLLCRQTPLAGLGNIYASEVLLRAGIHPLTPGCDLSEDDLHALADFIRRVTREAIRRRGTTFYSFRDGFGRPGGFKPTIYGRQRCGRCRSAVVKQMAGGRGAYACPSCQKVRGSGSAKRRKPLPHP